MIRSPLVRLGGSTAPHAASHARPVKASLVSHRLAGRASVHAAPHAPGVAPASRFATRCQPVGLPLPIRIASESAAFVQTNCLSENAVLTFPKNGEQRRDRHENATGPPRARLGGAAIDACIPGLGGGRGHRRRQGAGRRGSQGAELHPAGRGLRRQGLHGRQEGVRDPAHFRESVQRRDRQGAAGSGSGGRASSSRSPTTSSTSTSGRRR